MPLAPPSRSTTEYVQGMIHVCIPACRIRFPLGTFKTPGIKSSLYVKPTLKAVNGRNRLLRMYLVCDSWPLPFSEQSLGLSQHRLHRVAYNNNYDVHAQCTVI